MSPAGRRKRGLSSTVSIGVIVLVVIIAAAGWSAYAAFPVTQTSISTTTVNGGAGSVAATQTVTQTITQTGSASSSGSPSEFLVPTTTNDSFTIATLAGVSNFALFGFAKQIGTISQYAPNAKTTTFASGGQLASALATGQVQLELLDTSAPIPGMAKGGPIVIVANLLPTPLPWAIYVLGNSSYKTLSDLHGKAFGVTSLGTTTDFITEYALKTAMGWQLNKDYTLAADGSFAAKNAAMLAGTLPAQAGAPTADYDYAASGQFRAIYNFTLGYPSVSLLAYKPFVQQHPNAVRAALDGLLKAAYAWDSNSTAALSFLETNYHMSKAGAQFNYGVLQYSIDGAMSLSANQQAANFMLIGGAITQNVTMSNYISREFVPITA